MGWMSDLWLIWYEEHLFRVCFQRCVILLTDVGNMNYVTWERWLFVGGREGGGSGARYKSDVRKFVPML